jgi:hypothetical protein
VQRHGHSVERSLLITSSLRPHARRGRRTRVLATPGSTKKDRPPYGNTRIDRLDARHTDTDNDVKNLRGATSTTPGEHVAVLASQGIAVTPTAETLLMQAAPTAAAPETGRYRDRNADAHSRTHPLAARGQPAQQPGSNALFPNRIFEAAIVGKAADQGRQGTPALRRTREILWSSERGG